LTSEDNGTGNYFLVRDDGTPRMAIYFTENTNTVQMNMMPKELHRQQADDTYTMLVTSATQLRDASMRTQASRDKIPILSVLTAEAETLSAQRKADEEALQAARILAAKNGGNPVNIALPSAPSSGSASGLSLPSWMQPVAPLAKKAAAPKSTGGGRAAKAKAVPKRLASAADLVPPPPKRPARGAMPGGGLDGIFVDVASVSGGEPALGPESSAASAAGASDFDPNDKDSLAIEHFLSGQKDIRAINGVGASASVNVLAQQT
jgi:hypothetical protein